MLTVAVLADGMRTRELVTAARTVSPGTAIIVLELDGDGAPEVLVEAVAPALRSVSAHTLVVAATPTGMDVACEVAGRFDIETYVVPPNRFVESSLHDARWQRLAVARSGPHGGIATVHDPSDVAEAEFVVCAGAGVATRLPLVESVVRAFQAGLGVTRGAIERGGAGRAGLLGVSGRTVAPSVYLGLGVSGRDQHMVGIRPYDALIAVNIDPDAPIARVATHLAIADAGDVCEALIDHLSGASR